MRFQEGGRFPQRTVVIHGGSDCSASFRHLKNCLVTEGLDYADYESREDNISRSSSFQNTMTLVELAVDRVTKYMTVRTTPRKH